VREAEIMDNILVDVAESYGDLLRKKTKMEYDLQDYHDYLQKMRTEHFTEPSDKFFEKYSDLLDEYNDLRDKIRHYEDSGENLNSSENENININKEIESDIL